MSTGSKGRGAGGRGQGAGSGGREALRGVQSSRFGVHPAARCKLGVGKNNGVWNFAAIEDKYLEMMVNYGALGLDSGGRCWKWRHFVAGGFGEPLREVQNSRLKIQYWVLENATGRREVKCLGINANCVSSGD